MKDNGRKNDCGHIHYSGVICKVQILHYYECGWSCDLKKVVFNVQSGSGVKRSGPRLK